MEELDSAKGRNVYYCLDPADVTVIWILDVILILLSRLSNNWSNRKNIYGLWISFFWSNIKSILKVKQKQTPQSKFLGSEKEPIKLKTEMNTFI